MKLSWPAGRRTAMKKARKAYELAAKAGDEGDDIERRMTYDAWQVEGEKVPECHRF